MLRVMGVVTRHNHTRWPLHFELPPDAPGLAYECKGKHVLIECDAVRVGGFQHTPAKSNFERIIEPIVNDRMAKVR